MKCLAKHPRLREEGQVLLLLLVLIISLKGSRQDEKENLLYPKYDPFTFLVFQWYYLKYFLSCLVKKLCCWSVVFQLLFLVFCSNFMMSYCFEFSRENLYNLQPLRRRGHTFKRSMTLSCWRRAPRPRTSVHGPWAHKLTILQYHICPQD